MEQGEDMRRSSSRKEKKKKRKRSDVEIETFSKDTAAETKIIPQIDGNIAPSVELSVKMESFRESSDKIAPVVGYFPSGFDPLKHRMSNEAGDDPKIRVFRNKQFSNRLQVVVSPKESKVEYVGTSFLGEATAPQVCTYALGVLDKETKRLKVVPITANKPEPEFRPPMSEVVQALVRLVQRANMSKRTTGGEEQRSTPRADDSDIQEYMF